MSVPTIPAPNAPRNPQTPPVPKSPGARRSSSVRPRTGDLAVDTTTCVLLDLGRSPSAATVLPHGKAEGRYRCSACQHPLELAAATGPTPQYTARFRHAHSDRCQASTDQHTQIRTALHDTLALADHLHNHQRALTIRVTAAPTEPGHTSPLALVIDHPAAGATVHLADTLTDRQLAWLQRHRAPAGRHWVVFNRRSPAHWQPAGTISVRCHRRDLTHTTLTPTALQRRLAAAGYAVAWREGDVLLLPYGGHPFTYPQHPGEDWSGALVTRHRDWKISQPRPGDDAAWWGLIPVPLHALATPALLSAAIEMMTGIQACEPGRETSRRGQARTRAAAQPAPESEQFLAPGFANAAVPTRPTVMGPVSARPPSPSVPVPPPSRRIAWRTWLAWLALRSTTPTGTVEARGSRAIGSVLRVRTRLNRWRSRKDVAGRR